MQEAIPSSHNILAQLVSAMVTVQQCSVYDHKGSAFQLNADKRRGVPGRVTLQQKSVSQMVSVS